MGKFAGPFSENNVGVLVGQLSVQGGAEIVTRDLAVNLDSPIYTLRYDAQRFDKDFHNDVQGRIRRLTDKDDDTVIQLMESDEIIPFSVGGTVALDVEDYADLEMITSDILIVGDIEGLPIAAKSGKPFLVYLHHAGKNFTDHLWDNAEGSEGLREKLKILKNGYLKNRRNKKYAKKAGFIMTNSQRTLERTNEVWGYPKDQMRVVYPPVDTDFCQPNNDPEDLLGLNEYFLAPQRLEAYKNIHLLIEAAKMAQKHVVFTGTGTMEEYLRREAQYSKYVHALGYVEGEMLRTLYQGAEGVLQGTMREDFGIVPIEAMACGVPCLLPGSGGFLETVGDGYEKKPDLPMVTSRGKLLNPEEFNHRTLATELENWNRDDYASPEELHEKMQKYSNERFITEVIECLDLVID